MTKAEGQGVREMVATYVTFDELCRQGRDSVWAYVARNLSRPLALSFGAGWANVVVGNPPWVAFRHMSADLQKRFRELAKGERVYVGGRFATQNDLAALFTVRAPHLYLRSGGRLAFVMPLAALTRGQFEKLRKGSFRSARIAWDEAWTMDDDVQPLFPVPSCVVFGRTRHRQALPDKVRAYSGGCRRATPPRKSPTRADRDGRTRRSRPRHVRGRLAVSEIFRQGATLVPRMLCLVERSRLGRLGEEPDRAARGEPPQHPGKAALETLPASKHRWRRNFCGRCCWAKASCLIACSGRLRASCRSPTKAVLDAEAAANRGYRGCKAGCLRAEAIWNANAESGTMKLVGRWNYHNEFGAQFPIRTPSCGLCEGGTLPAACLVRDEAVIDHKLYWGSPAGEAEAYFLTAVLNSETSRSRVADNAVSRPIGAHGISTR